MISLKTLENSIIKKRSLLLKAQILKCATPWIEHQKSLNSKLSIIETHVNELERIQIEYFIANVGCYSAYVLYKHMRFDNNKLIDLAMDLFVSPENLKKYLKDNCREVINELCN